MRWSRRWSGPARRTEAIERAERLLDLVFHADLPRLTVAVTEEASEPRRALTELDETPAQVLPYADAFIDLIDVAARKEA